MLFQIQFAKNLFTLYCLIAFLSSKIHFLKIIEDSEWIVIILFSFVLLYTVYLNTHTQTILKKKYQQLILSNRLYTPRNIGNR